jgi:predicted membrane protein (TIGR00267 family)
MNFRHWLHATHNRLDIVAGLIDGILTALTLAAAKILHHDGSLSLALVGKVGAASACATVFVFFVAHYTELRAELVRSERELNLLAHGRLATTRLGRQVLRESAVGAIVASICSLIGAMLPLFFSFLFPGMPLAGLALTVLLLGILGAALAWSTFGSPIVWALGMMAGGIVLAVIGVKLDIVS